ncbi:lysosomal amino acid transporter 1 homolog isoform X2 [Neophocaena asiaeorientalis asiaeorientalis]|uniref:Lysosomal amino acid transporter 1 homolog isoform X2 n=1 Tax=Neophocaena asiaeorientalis asiaeorientalis TaxID=1706337 RepID=A0A341BU42_NEOAA|nr:lysosomal amino acid transporter 1 homolog isoform X2 [Neophocaena asiaeorientalis asiaeorientalis]XP_024605730.1 lysosomal amino acid transporter 1 homolog isoform X2 [Neophocaena asiaeorientalis asiaeorientalis]
MVWRKLGSRNFSSCPNGSSQWMWDVFGECAWDDWDKASVGLGLISILCFAASTLPQYIKACKMGNMDQALSLWFLLGWIGGDSCNLIGSFLADQLPLQTYTAVYYVLADVLMLSLYFHYKFKKRPSLFPAEVDTGDLLLAVRLGDAGEHAVWAKRAAQKPRSRPGRGQLCAAPPALARGQPGRPAARHHHLHTVPDIQGCRHLIRAPATPPQLSRTQTPAKPRMTGTCRCHTQEGRSTGSDGAADPGLGRGGSWGCLELPARPPTPNTSETS